MTPNKRRKPGRKTGGGRGVGGKRKKSPHITKLKKEKPDKKGKYGVLPGQMLGKRGTVEHHGGGMGGSEMLG